MCDQYICSQQQTLENKRFFLIVLAGNNVNEPPILEAGGYPTGLPLSESTKVGTEVFVLKGHDPEGSPVKYGIQLTDHFVVNPRTGVITLAKPLNREVRKKYIDWFRTAAVLSKEKLARKLHAALIWATKVDLISHAALGARIAIFYVQLHLHRLSPLVCFWFLNFL